MAPTTSGSHVALANGIAKSERNDANLNRIAMEATPVSKTNAVKRAVVPGGATMVNVRIFSEYGETDEVVFYDGADKKRPRLLVSLFSILSMKSLGERQALKLTHTEDALEKCRTAYYKEITYLRELLRRLRNDERPTVDENVHFFHPPSLVVAPQVQEAFDVCIEELTRNLRAELYEARQKVALGGDMSLKRLIPYLFHTFGRTEVIQYLICFASDNTCDGDAILQELRDKIPRGQPGKPNAEMETLKNEVERLQARVKEMETHAEAERNDFLTRLEMAEADKLNAESELSGVQAEMMKLEHKTLENAQSEDMMRKVFDMEQVISGLEHDVAQKNEDILRLETELDMARRVEREEAEKQLRAERQVFESEWRAAREREEKMWEDAQAERRAAWHAEQCGMEEAWKKEREAVERAWKEAESQRWNQEEDRLKSLQQEADQRAIEDEAAKAAQVAERLSQKQALKEHEERVAQLEATNAELQDKMNTIHNDVMMVLRPALMCFSDALHAMEGGESEQPLVFPDAAPCDTPTSRRPKDALVEELYAMIDGLWASTHAWQARLWAQCEHEKTDAMNALNAQLLSVKDHYENELSVMEEQFIKDENGDQTASVIPSEQPEAPIDTDLIKGGGGVISRPELRQHVMRVKIEGLVEYTSVLEKLLKDSKMPKLAERAKNPALRKPWAYDHQEDEDFEESTVPYYLRSLAKVAGKKRYHLLFHDAACAAKRRQRLVSDRKEATTALFEKRTIEALEFLRTKPFAINARYTSPHSRSRSRSRSRSLSQERDTQSGSRAHTSFPSCFSRNFPVSTPPTSVPLTSVPLSRGAARPYSTPGTSLPPSMPPSRPHSVTNNIYPIDTGHSPLPIATIYTTTTNGTASSTARTGARRQQHLQHALRKPGKPTEQPLQHPASHVMSAPVCSYQDSNALAHVPTSTALPAMSSVGGDAAIAPLTSIKADDDIAVSEYRGFPMRGPFFEPYSEGMFLFQSTGFHSSSKARRGTPQRSLSPRLHVDTSLQPSECCVSPTSVSATRVTSRALSPDGPQVHKGHALHCGSPAQPQYSSSPFIIMSHTACPTQHTACPAQHQPDDPMSKLQQILDDTITGPPADTMRVVPPAMGTSGTHSASRESTTCRQAPCGTVSVDDTTTTKTSSRPPTNGHVADKPRATRHAARRRDPVQRFIDQLKDTRAIALRPHSSAATCSPGDTASRAASLLGPKQSKGAPKQLRSRLIGPPVLPSDFSCFPNTLLPLRNNYATQCTLSPKGDHCGARREYPHVQVAAGSEMRADALPSLPKGKMKK